MEHVLGYLITLANIQNYGHSGGTLRDLSIKVSEVQTLYNDLQAIPELDISCFKNSGFFRYNNTGKYLSKNLREFMFQGKGDPRDEGVVLTLFFDDGQGSLNDGNDSLSIFLHKEIGDGVKDQVQSYLDQRYGYGREKRAVDVAIGESPLYEA